MRLRCLLPFAALLPIVAARQASPQRPAPQPVSQFAAQLPAPSPQLPETQEPAPSKAGQLPDPQPPAPGPAPAAAPAPASPFRLIAPAEPPSISPGALELLELEGRFQAAVVAGGGPAFAAWFAPDALTLPEGRLPVYGLGAIAAQATWAAKDYQLTWQPHGAQMGPSGDMGFTWGHYTARTLSPAGPSAVQSGRYLTIWRKLPDGTWKVAMDASAAEEPAAPAAMPPPQEPVEPPAANAPRDGAEVPK